MDARIKPPEWRARAIDGSVSRSWTVEENVGGVWREVGTGALFSEEDAKLLAGAPVLLTKLVGMDLMVDRLRTTMARATSMRHIRETGADKALQAVVEDVRKTIAEFGGPRDKNNGGRG